ncbi:type II CRISPR RNA-guided endonuclease Cas9 [Parabacteroides johnsonii]|uniref:type II CRISPR RNA-guided endonuclease Cas9 n=1 Tax=Parabacteroides johnsonii TaxID=387661 RepID=UPI002432E869|nr:type II CRISPR RNA-guided endonuclease Cas9 [Parabacteroides johnsonii]
MKKILGLDLGTSSIGWALVNEAENSDEVSSIIKLGVRVNPLTVDEMQNFEKGKSITTNADRTLKRSMRRNLQRYKLRRDALIELLKKVGFITDKTILSEQGNRTTFETYRLRAKAAEEEISLEELARVLLMINKKRGYKSSRKAKGEEEGALIDGMEIAKKLYDEDLTPGQLCLQLLESGKKFFPDFYRSDLQEEFNKIWNFQKQFNPFSFCDVAKEEVKGKNKSQTWAILAKYFVETKKVNVWNEHEAQTENREEVYKLVGLKRTVKGEELKKENYRWRVQALTEQLDLEKIAVVLQEINGQISASSGYLGAISDRSKVLYFNRQTVGQYQMAELNKNPNMSLRNMVFYRQDYLDEFNVIWEKQAEFHKELTPELKKEIRDIIIFYQRRLKSQKGLISFCEFENREVVVEKEGKKQTKIIGCKVIPRSHPLFQEFKIWQTLNNIEVFVGEKKGKRKKSNVSSDLFSDTEDALITEGRRFLYQEEKKILAKELSIKKGLTKAEILRLLFENPQELDINFKQIDGNQTGFALFSAYSNMIEKYGYEPLDFKKPAEDLISQLKTVFTDLGWNTDLLFIDLDKENKEWEKQPYFRLWHLLYSFEGDNTPTGNGKLIEKIMQLCGIEKEYAIELANVSLQDDYGSLSAKAIKKILLYLKEGNQYDMACEYAGYRHSKSSLTKEEIENKVLKDKLEILPKNSLRNPVVEKILNQMVNVINTVMEVYGRPDEIRVELARELKKSAKEREELTKAVAKNTREHEEIRKVLQSEFGMINVSRNDIIRYKLYEELKDNGYKTLYSNQYIPREKLFSKEIDIEHIIPQSRLFDDSLSNKTLEYKSINIEKGNKTAYDFVKEKYGEEGLQQYLNRCENLCKDKKAKLRKLKMELNEIPDGFIDRDLRNTQYIAKKALSMLTEICRRVVATTGSITDKLREDWQLVDVMKELNLPKYEALGLVEVYEDKDGRKIKRIKDWTKRNDHRHHAMDALTVAFTKDVFIQYFNNKNAAWESDSKEHTNIVGIKTRYFESGKAVPPIPLGQFRVEAKCHLENLLVSIKAKNKVVTTNVNCIKKKGGTYKNTQQTPRGQLHLETIYGSHNQYVTKIEKVNASFDAVKIATVSKQDYRNALLKRLEVFGNDPKKAFTGKNSLEKNPIYLDRAQTIQVPDKVQTVELETAYTIRKPVDPTLNVDKVVDKKIRLILEQRLKEYGGDAKKAFVNLDENPIWLNEEKGISIKRVTIRGISKAQALHDKKDKDGNFILDGTGKRIPVDFVNTGNNHHVAIYRKPVLDKKGQVIFDDEGNPMYELDEDVVPFFEAVTRANLGIPIIDKDYKKSEGWQFLFSMKQNEYFVFPNEKTGFNPKEVDLLDPDNYAMISPNLFRVQKISTKNYMFRHHLETTVIDNKSLRKIAWELIQAPNKLVDIVKVRINHIGQIVSVGEY